MKCYHYRKSTWIFILIQKTKAFRSLTKKKKMHNYYLMQSVEGMLLELYNKMAIIAGWRICF